VLCRRTLQRGQRLQHCSKMLWLCTFSLCHPVPCQVAINNEVLVAVSNKNYAWPGGMLSVWAENAKRAGGCSALCLFSCVWL